MLFELKKYEQPFATWDRKYKHGEKYKLAELPKGYESRFQKIIGKVKIKPPKKEQK